MKRYRTESSPAHEPVEKIQVKKQGFVCTLMNQYEIPMHTIDECQELQGILLQITRLSQRSANATRIANPNSNLGLAPHIYYS